MAFFRTINFSEPLPSIATPEVPAQRAIRVATAIARHLGRGVTLDGRPFLPERAERHPRAVRPDETHPATIGFTGTSVASMAA